MIKNHAVIMVIVMIGHALDTIMDIIGVITMDIIMGMDIFTIAIIIIIMIMVIIMDFMMGTGGAMKMDMTMDGMTMKTIMMITVNQIMSMVTHHIILLKGAKIVIIQNKKRLKLDKRIATSRMMKKLMIIPQMIL